MCHYITPVLLRDKMMLGLWLRSIPSLSWEPLLLLWSLRRHRENVTEGFRHLISELDLSSLLRNVS